MKRTRHEEKGTEGVSSREASPSKIDDRRVVTLRPLMPPACLEEEIPLTDEIKEVVRKARRTAEAIIHKKDDRLLCIVGPCSVHDPKAAKEYCQKLIAFSRQVEQDLYIIMRVYFEKPRTTVGWKGLINDPHLDGSFRINDGLRIGRGLLRDINAMGMGCGVEFLDTISPQYIADLVSWGAIGARTTESQVHRELASGLSTPVGFKNSTEGNVKVAVEAIKAASVEHCFLGVGKHGLSAIVQTTGNESCHVILRGGEAGPNYDEKNIASVVKLCNDMKVSPTIMVDCSHGNSRKIHTNQPTVAAEVGKQVASGNVNIIGVMLESFIVEGTQKIPATGPKDLVYGQSITDACLSWSQTEPVLKELANAVRLRRQKSNQ